MQLVTITPVVTIGSTTNDTITAVTVSSSPVTVATVPDVLDVATVTNVVAVATVPDVVTNGTADDSYVTVASIAD